MTSEEPEVPATGAVFTFGKSKFADNVPSKFWIKKDLVLGLACGDEHTAVLTQSGRLFTFGSNEWGQLGLGHTNNVLKPSCVKVLKPDKVILVACGKAHTIVHTASMKLLAFGSNSDGQLGLGKDTEMTPHPVEMSSGCLAGQELEALAAGVSHSMALTKATNQIFVWGSNTEGQLGLGPDSEETVYHPTLLDLNAEFGPIEGIDCGYYHSAILCESGLLFTFGEPEGGRLGLGPQYQEVFEPTRVPLQEMIVKVSCGGSHTVVVTDTGKVYSFGVSSHGQLGLGTSVSETHSPSLVKSLVDNHLRVSQVSCGENHTAVVTEDGHLITFGDGRHGKLCLDMETMTNHFKPAMSERFEGFRVDNVFCGGCHTMVCAKPLSDQEKNERNTGFGNGYLQGGHANGGALTEDINLVARRKHREEMVKTLPPIKPLRKAPRVLAEDPEAIVNVGSELIELPREEEEAAAETNNGNKDNDDHTNDDGESMNEERDERKEEEEERMNGKENEEDSEEDDRSELEEAEETGQDVSADDSTAKHNKSSSKISSFFKGLRKPKETPEPSPDPDDKSERSESPSRERNQKKRVTFFSRSKSKEPIQPDSDEDDGQDAPEEEDEDPEERADKAKETSKVKANKSRTCVLL